MDQSRPHRPRISRETRLLLTTAFLAIAVLWGLARVRFPDRPAAPNAVQPLLTQLAARPTFNDLAAEISQVRNRLEPLLVVFDGAVSSDGGGEAPLEPHLALRVREDLAVVLLDAQAPPGELRQHVAALDRASRLAIVRVPGPPAPPPVPWRPADPRQPRFLIATDLSANVPTLRPVYVGSLEPITSPIWRTQIWLAPAHADVMPGSFVFTADGLLAGLVVSQGNRRAIVPGEVLLAEAERLAVPTATEPGYVGISVQALTPAIARATGATSGVVVTWVDPDGPAADAVAAGDIVEAIGGEDVPSPLHFNTRTARLTAGETVPIRIRRAGETSEVPVTAAGTPAPPASASLGLMLRASAGGGAEVLQVEPGSVADRAGLTAGDVITRIADATSPTPAAIRSAFAEALNGEAVLVAYRRGGTHHVTALEKW